EPKAGPVSLELPVRPAEAALTRAPLTRTPTLARTRRPERQLPRRQKRGPRKRLWKKGRTRPKTRPSLVTRQSPGRSLVRKRRRRIRT
ncbi:unnamed protein product, partial [Polarella glacialis]